MTQIEKIRKMIGDELVNWDQPSIAVGIIKDGEVVLNDGFGMRDVENNLKSDADTMYQIGSCSKAFTAACCGILVDRGLLKWDEPIKTYMPWVEFKDPYTTNHVTVRDILCHRTGVARHDLYWIGMPVTREGMVRNLRNMQTCGSFRSIWCYQNTCFVLAGMLIETISGMTWEEFVKKEIFEPLGMTRSTFYVDAIDADNNHANPYKRLLPTDTKGYHRIPYLKLEAEDMAAGVGAPFGPAGSIVSTVNDMLKWLSLNMNNGKFGDKQIVSEESMKEIHKPQMIVPSYELGSFVEKDFYFYGFGWHLSMHKGHLIVEHGGHINGFSAQVLMVPDIDLGVVILNNFDSSFNTIATSSEIVDTYLGMEGGNWHNEFRTMIQNLLAGATNGLDEVRAQRVRGTVPSHVLTEYAGSFVNPTYGELVVSEREGKLYLAYGEGESELEHLHYDTFIPVNPNHYLCGVSVLFGSDNSGKVATISIDMVMQPNTEIEVFNRK